jgi:hypothetical protein
MSSPGTTKPPFFSLATGNFPGYSIFAWGDTGGKEVYVCDAVRPDRFLVRNLKVTIRNAQLFLTTHVPKHRQAR